MIHSISCRRCPHNECQSLGVNGLPEGKITRKDWHMTSEVVSNPGEFWGMCPDCAATWADIEEYE